MLQFSADVTRLLLFVLAFAALPAAAAPRAHAPRAQKSLSSDWDDTAVFMTSHVYLKSKSGAPELKLTTAEMKDVQPLLGRPGKYEDRYIDADTYRDMTDREGHNVFLRDLQNTIRTKKNWQAPGWSALVAQLSTPQGARRASIITAREHSQQSIYEGLKWLRKQGLIRYLPPKKSIYAVNSPDVMIDGEPLKGTVPERKLAVQVALLDRLQADSQRDHGRRQAWHFADDDWNNFEATRTGLSAHLDRWPNVDIVLHYTGSDATHTDTIVQLTRR